jgi:hypothetical protein
VHGDQRERDIFEDLKATVYCIYVCDSTQTLAKSQNLDDFSYKKVETKFKMPEASSLAALETFVLLANGAKGSAAVSLIQQAKLLHFFRECVKRVSFFSNDFFHFS